MKHAYFGVAIAALVFGQLGVVAQADTRDANCEVRKDGDKQKGKSGPCTFSQRQGYIDIDLKNGDTLRLSPTGSNQYKDQNHNKVHRVSSGPDSEEFKWEGGKHVTVTFTGGYNGYNNNGYNQYNNNYNNNSSRENSDYQRGYQDGLAGRYDQYDHTQAYKNGVTAGEAAARNGQGNQYNNYNNGKHNNGKHNNGKHNGNQGGYTIENIGNGDFEIKWPSGCIADYDRYGINTGYTSCSQDMKQRSDQVARQQAR